MTTPTPTNQPETPRLIDASQVIRLCMARAHELDDGTLRKRLDAASVRAAQELLAIALRVQAMAADAAAGNTPTGN